MSEEPQKNPSVLVIDDHKMVVIGIKLLIVDMFSEFYQAGNGAAGIDLAIRHQPQLVIVDNILPDVSGDVVTREIRRRCPGTRILGYSFNMNAAAVLKMVEAGIHGYVDKSEDNEEFTRAVNSLLEGRDYFSKEARHHIVKGPVPGVDLMTGIADRTGFSAGEIRIIRLICQQKNIEEISRQLQLPEEMVTQYRGGIFSRIGARNKADLIKFALQQGIIELDDL